MKLFRAILLISGLMLEAGVSTLATNSVPPLPESTRTISTTNQQYAYVYGAYEIEYSNALHVVFVARATNTVTVESPIPLLAFDVEYNDSLTDSNGWKHVDTFWMPLGTNNQTSFYRVEPRFLKGEN